MKKTYKFDILKITKCGGQTTCHRTVKAVDFVDALKRLKLGVKTFGEGGKFKFGMWFDEHWTCHPIGMNLGGRVVRFVDGKDVVVDSGDL